MAIAARAHRRVHAAMPEELVGEVDALVGKRRRGRIITDAVEEKVNASAGSSPSSG